MEKFIGRKEELNALVEHLKNHKQENILVYGKRRIGKTELIKEALRLCMLPCVFFSCKQSGYLDNMESLGNLVQKTLSLEFTPINFEHILDLLFRHSIKEKIILVLDEYPYLRESTKGLDSILQNLIDKYKFDSRLKIILAGSYVRIMDEIIEESFPLYGRITLKINLKEMDYLDSSLFYSKYSNEDKVKTYAVFGGIPFYNSLIEDSKSFEENLFNLILDDKAPLPGEFLSIVQDEAKRVDQANNVFQRIAQGCHKFNDLKAKTGLENTSLNRIIKKLSELEFIEQVFPINAKGNTKKALYEIKDNFISFYFTFIFNNYSYLTTMSPTSFYKMFIKNKFEERFVPKKFEDILKEYLLRLNKQDKITPTLFDIGKYWYNDPIKKESGEFDVATKDESGYRLIEVNYTNSPITIKVVKEEIRQTKDLKLQNIRLGFASKSGFDLPKEFKEKYLLISLDEIYALKT